MGWSEAARLARELERDLSSRVAAVTQGWRWPWSHTDNLLAHLLEALVGEQAYPRPWDRTAAEIAAHNERVKGLLAAARARPMDDTAKPMTALEAVALVDDK